MFLESSPLTPWSSHTLHSHRWSWF